VPYVDRVHTAGATLMATVGSVEEARNAVEAGVDAVVGQGWDRGPPPERRSHDAARPPGADAVGAGGTDVPAVAAGGIADGRGIAAALALGADGAWLGTRSVATREADVVDDYRERIADAEETDTVRSRLFDGDRRRPPPMTGSRPRTEPAL